MLLTCNGRQTAVDRNNMGGWSKCVPSIIMKCFGHFTTVYVKAIAGSH